MMRDAKDICGAITADIVLLAIGAVMMMIGSDIGMVGVMLALFAFVDLMGWSGHMDLYFKSWRYWWYKRTRK